MVSMKPKDIFFARQQEYEEKYSERDENRMAYNVFSMELKNKKREKNSPFFYSLESLSNIFISFSVNLS